MIYRLDYSTAAEDYRLIFTDELEADMEFDDLIKDDTIVEASLTKLYIYGGICQGEKIIKTYTKETST